MTTPPEPVDANTFMEDILINLSHELRTPLTAAKGYATSLLRYYDRLPREERLAMVGEIDLACDRLESVIAHMLQTARLLQESLTLHRQPHDLVQLTQAAITRMQRATADDATQAHPIVFQHDPLTPLLVEVDAGLLTTTLAQLLENARNYSPRGLPMLITLQSQGEMAEWSVQDRGIGIAAEHLARIFEPFYRVPTASTREVGGLGLGLTISQRVLLLYGSQLRVESQLGIGSRFWFELPLVPAL